MAGQASQSRRRPSNSHVVALLSLKILLLAFFILLNALASFEDDRQTAVVDSVRQAFQGLLPNKVNFERSPAALDILDGAAQLTEELHRIFSDSLPVVERSDSPEGRTLRVDLPIEDLFAAEGDDLMPEGAETLRLIAGALGDERFAGLSYRVDLLYGLEGSASGLEGNRAALTRAGRLARALEQEGMPPSRLSTGFLPGFGGKARFHFTIEGAPEAAGEGSGEEG